MSAPRPWEVSPCAFDTVNGKCIVHGVPYKITDGRRCQEGWRYERLAEYREQSDSIGGLLNARTLIEKHIKAALIEYRGTVMAVPFGIQDAVFNDALREVVSEFTIPFHLEVTIGEIKDRLSDLDDEENADGHTKAEQEKMDKELNG